MIVKEFTNSCAFTFFRVYSEVSNYGKISDQLLDMDLVQLSIMSSMYQFQRWRSGKQKTKNCGLVVYI